MAIRAIRYDAAGVIFKHMFTNVCFVYRCLQETESHPDTYIHTYTHTHTHTYIHTLTYIHVRTYVHTYIHTYIIVAIIHTKSRPL